MALFFIGFAVGAAGATAGIAWAVGGFKNFRSVLFMRITKAQ